jgi:hypothetical protein
LTVVLSFGLGRGRGDWIASVSFLPVFYIRLTSPAFLEELMLARLISLFILFLCIPLSAGLFFPDESHGNPVFDISNIATTVDLPSRMGPRQSTPSDTLQPVMSVNLTDWADQTNELCIAAIDPSSILNPAGLVPCYNVLMFDPNTGNFISEVRLFHVAAVEQANVMSQTLGSSGVLFEFPHAEITDSPGLEAIANVLGKRQVRRQVKLFERQNVTAGITLSQSFYLNGTADITQSYFPLSHARC